MDNWFNSKWFVRVVALFLSVLLYVFVFYEVKTTNSDDRIIPSTIDFQVLNEVPVNIKIDRDRFVVSGVPEEVTVSLEGTKSILTRTVLQRNIEVYADLTELEEGKHIIDLQHDKVPNELTVYIEPKTIEIEIEERATKEFVVSVDFINKDKLPEGYELGESSVNPGTVNIMSSRSTIDKIAIVKVYVDVEGLNESIKNREIPVNIYDSLGNVLNGKIDPSSVVVSVDVNNPSKSVPIDVDTTGELPEGLTLTSATVNVDEVEVFATSDVLSTFTNISTEKIDLSKITKSGEIDAKLIAPDGSRIPNDTVKVTVELEQTRVIESIPIELINGEDVEVSFQQPNKKTHELTIVGSDQKISELTEEDFDVSIDVGGLTEGEHEVPVIIKGPEDIKISTEFKKITIVII